jgi:hypothetical protein
VITGRQPHEIAADRAAAEDLRRQFQERHAAKPNAILPDHTAMLSWTETRQDQLLQISKSAGLEGDDAIAAVEAYKALLANTKPRTDYDDPNWERLIELLSAKIESACAILKIPLKSGVVIGVDPIASFEATQYRVPLTDVSVLSVGAHLFPLCSMISKAMARSLLYTETDDGPVICYDPDKVLAKVKSDPALIRYWASILFSFATDYGPGLVPFELQEPYAANARFQILEAMELYVVAHEFGHHITAPINPPSFPLPSGNNENQTEEYRADFLAGIILVYLGGDPNPTNIFAGSRAGAALLLSVLDMIGRTRALLSTGRDSISTSESHPTIKDRIAAFGATDMFVHEAERPMLVDARTCFTKISEGLWQYLRDDVLKALTVKES